jgi:hypothetical protein
VPAPRSETPPAPRAKKPAARRSDPEEIAALATTTVIEAQPEPGRQLSTPRPRREPPVLAGDPPQAGPLPVFADHSGRRAKRLRAAAIATTALCATYVTVVAAGALAGPVGPSAAPVLLPAPSSSAPAVIPAPQLDAEVVPEPRVTTTTRASRTTTTPRARTTTTAPRRPRVAPRVPAVDPPVVRAPAVAPAEPPAPARPVAPAEGAAPAAPDDAGEA